jgi:hypothetical protein
MTPRTLVQALLAALLVTVTLHAQTPTLLPTGTVSGHVVCADTQRPARFATVILLGVPSATPTPRPDPKASSAQQMAAMRSSMNSMKLVQTQTDVDGAFISSSVNPGDYYVFASVPGYIQPRNLVEAAIDAGADPAKSIPGVPQIHVTADHISQAEVSVERGAAVSGQLRWDDGSPVTRVIMSLIPPGPNKRKDLPPEFAMLSIASATGGGGGITFTDDLGQYRIAGVAPGDYLVKAVLTTRSGFAMQGGAMNLAGAMGAQTLTVFAPAAFHQKDAKPITLHATEEHTGADLSFNLSGLQTISGTVSSAEDHHHLNAGSLKLEDASDKAFTRTGSIDPNGSYSLTFVPPGTYTLSVSDASDEAPSTKSSPGLLSFNQTDTLRSYQDANKTVVVLDSAVPNQDFELSPAARTQQKPDLNQLLIAPPPPPPPAPNN